MTRVRPVFEGDTIHIQRRAREGRHFLVPHRETLQLVRYAYAVAAERCGLILHAVCVMSTHTHVIATDPEGRHPQFTHYAHRLIALGLKRFHGIDGTVFTQGGASVQRLVGRDAIIEALAYLRMNPVAAGLVAHDGAYPGVFGVEEKAPLKVYEERIARPSCFAGRTTLPEAARFVLRPAERLLDELGPKRAAERIARAIRRHRENAKAKRKRDELAIVGMKEVLATDVWRRAPKPKRAPFRPTFKGVLADALRQASDSLRRFRRAYAEALATFRDGDTSVCFPAGTYKMRLMGCKVAKLGPALAQGRVVDGGMLPVAAARG